MESTTLDKEMLGGIKTEDDVWAECTKVILGLLEDSLLKEDQADRSGAKRSSSLREELRDKTNGIRRDQLMGGTSPFLVSNDTAAVKRKRSYADGERDRKMQKISSNLANEIARSLTMNDTPMQQQRPPGDDVDMNDTTKLVSPWPRIIRKISNRRARRYAPIGDSAPIPTLRRISLSGSKATMDFDQWLKTQAQRQNLNMLEYRQAFYEKKRQLQQCLAQIAHVDHTKTDDERFSNIKDSLSKVLRIADELSGDHTLSIVEIFPEWRSFEGYINKIAAYVQSIEDMKLLVSESIPRTNDLLHDIRRLQTVLDAKTPLYGDNLIQNGLEWKAMGLPVDENLLAMVKGWFYNLCIGLLCELDTECSKVQSLVTDMRELLFNVEGDKLMEAILTGLEFISGVISFIGLPSRKLVYGCRVLATIYGRYVSEHLDQLHQTVVDKSTQEKGAWMDVKMAPSTMRSARIDIRFMQYMESMTRILSSLQILQDAEASTSAVSQQQDSVSNTIPLGQQSVLDSESINVLENFTSMLVELTVRAISVVETSKTTSALKSANVMTKPETVYVHMEESLVTLADKIVDASGRDRADGPRLQQLHAYLEDVESSL